MRVRTYVLCAYQLMLSFLFTAFLFPPFVISVTAGSGNNSAWAPGDFLYSPCPAYINEQLAGGNTKKNDFPLLHSPQFRHRVWLQMPWHGIVLLGESN